MYEWGFFLNTTAFCIALSQCVSLIVKLLEFVIKLHLVKGTTHHYATHLQELMVLLMKLSLLPSGLLSENINIDCPLYPIWLFFFYLHLLKKLIVSYPIRIYFLLLFGEEVSFDTVLHSIFKLKSPSINH